ncbi:MAG: prepilin peptidase [Rickettsiales bacterium]|nr:prepilin peptidase [Rickettsiales bacterium]
MDPSGPGNPWTFWLIASGLLGAVVGSFLNVVSHRLPRGESLLRPGSSCPACKHPIRAWHNIPIVGWLLLGGRCFDCDAPFSIRYPAVEAGAAMLWMLVYLRLIPELETLLDEPLMLLTVVAYGSYFSALVAISLIDARHFIVPDVISLPLIPLGISLIAILEQSGIGASSLPQSVLGALLGAGSMLALAGIGRLLMGREALGMGDVKLVAAIGAWQGAHPTLLLCVFIASLIGSAAGISYMAIHGRKRHLKLPFGPYLCLGALSSWLAGEQLMALLLGG